MEYEYNECAATGSSIHLRGDRKKDSPLVMLLQMKMTIASSVYIEQQPPAAEEDTPTIHTAESCTTIVAITLCCACLLARNRVDFVFGLP